MNNKILVMAGIAAAQKWDIDLTKVNVTIVNNSEPFKVAEPLPQAVPVYPQETTTPIPPSDDMIFQSNNGTRWRKNNIEFWLAWGPVTHTLAIAILQRKD